MNILFAIIFFGIGVVMLYFGPKIFGDQKKEYSQYSVARGLVVGTEDFTGSRWIVRFFDSDGVERLGMDDRLCYNVFNPEKFPIRIIRGQEYDVYYWKPIKNTRCSINGKPVEHYIHFCNDGLYSIYYMKKQKQLKTIKIFGVLFLILSVIVFLFGQ